MNKEKTNRKIRLARINPEKIIKEIGDFIVEQIVRSGRTGGVVGLSGGVDSTITAALAKRAFDEYNKNYGRRKLELVGYIIPCKINSEEDTRDGIDIAKRLGIRYEIQDIQPTIDSYQHTNPEVLKNKYERGNLISRIRANVLNTKAATERKILIGTGNWDEDFGVGYYTLFGDGAAHMSPIGNLSKRLVKQLAVYLGFNDITNKTPSAGLEVNQTDFGDLGYDYDVVELVGEGIRQGFSLDELAKNNQVRELAQKQIVKYKKIFGKKKFSEIEEIVCDIFKRNEIAKAKAKIIHPPIAKISLEYNEN